ncbi:hypothetical protein R6Q57_027762 [Mikania cordata]
MSSSSSSSRYNSFDNRSSTHSDPSSSTDLTKNRRQSPDLSRTLAKSRSTRNAQNLSAMVKKFMASSTKPKPREFVLPTALLADDFKKKTSIRGATTGFKKLFAGKGDDQGEKKKKALPEARTLATVLKSERELLSRNKDQETEILHLNSMLQEKNIEVDKLKDLCLKQREEIKALKSAILFPDQEKQEDVSEELKQAKQIIPTLQRQVTSLTSQLLYLAQDLAEVKADKYSVMGCYEGLVSSPRTPTHKQEEATNSVEFSPTDHTTPGSPDDMFLNDLNPCLTPYANSKSRSKEHSSSCNNITTRSRRNEIGFGAQGRKLSKSSTDKHYVNSGKILGRGSDENKYTCIHG